VTIRVVLTDDQPLVRAGLRVLIADTPDLDVVGEAGTGAQAVQLVRDLRPDVVVMDIRMPGMDGIEATRMITAEHAAACVRGVPGAGIMAAWISGDGTGSGSFPLSSRDSGRSSKGCWTCAKPTRASGGW
jgi:DNA-binding NtrC family response regulator